MKNPIASKIVNSGDVEPAVATSFLKYEKLP